MKLKLEEEKNEPQALLELINIAVKTVGIENEQMMLNGIHFKRKIVAAMSVGKALDKGKKKKEADPAQEEADPAQEEKKPALKVHKKS